MFAILVALLLPLGALSRPLIQVHQSASASCIIAGVDYPNPHETLRSLSRRAIAPPPGLSRRTFADLLLWCHEHSGIVLAHHNPSCPAGSGSGDNDQPDGDSDDERGDSSPTTSSDSDEGATTVDPGPDSTPSSFGPGVPGNVTVSSGHASGAATASGPSGSGIPGTNGVSSSGSASNVSSGTTPSPSSAPGATDGDLATTPRPGFATAVNSCTSGSGTTASPFGSAATHGIATAAPSPAITASRSPPTSTRSALSSITRTTAYHPASATLTPTPCPPGQRVASFSATVGSLASAIICVVA